MKRLICLLFLVVLANISQAQTYTDGTLAPTAAEVTVIRDNIMGRTVDVSSLEYVPIQAHVVRKADQSDALSLSDLNKGIATLNHYFINAGIQFYLLGNAPNYIDNDALNEFKMANETAMTTAGKSGVAINLYCVRDIDYSGAGTKVGLHSRYPSNTESSNRIFVTNETFADGYTLLQAFGHYFGLLPTYGQNGITPTDEHADGDNCMTAGDFICDTGADPFSYERMYSNTEIVGCSYFGTAIDGEANTFNPPLDNFMSAYPNACKYRFSTNQYTRMAQALKERKTHTAYGLIGVVPVVAAPSGLTATIKGNGVLLNWTDNATDETGYIIERSELSPTSGFVALKSGGVAANVSTFIDFGVKAKKTYYYRVRPSNSKTTYSNTTPSITVPLVYCKPIYGYSDCETGSELHITGVKIQETGGNILLNNTSVCSTNDTEINNYTYYSSASTPAVFTNLTAGEKYDFTFFTNAYLQHITAWIDTNQDGVFGSDEIVYQSTGVRTSTDPHILSGFQLPINTQNGPTRMRVRSRNGTTSASVDDPCDLYSLGETEDYEINVLGGVTDTEAPSFLSSTPSISNEGTSSFDVNVVMNEPGKAYYIVVADGTHSSVTAAQVRMGYNSASSEALAYGVITVDSPILLFSRTASGISPGTAYDVYVVGEDDAIIPNLMAVPVKVDAETIVSHAEFSANKLLIYQEQEVQFTDLSTGAENRWAWEFGDGSVSMEQNPRHIFMQAGQFTVTLRINNGDKVERKQAYVTVLPNRAVPYLSSDGGNFEVNAADFGSEVLVGTTPLWQRGFPNGVLNLANSPTNVWKTILDGNVPKEKNMSALRTPNFDFSNEGRYKICFYKSMENIFYDGPYAVQVHYSTDKGSSWKRLGTYDDDNGTNWYSSNPSSGVSSTVVGDNQGWLEKSTNVQTTYDVSFLKGKENVAFRFVMYVDDTYGISSYLDGFMIDDFELQYTAPTPEFTADRKTIFPKETISFIDKSVSATSWEWDFGDGGTSSLQNPTHTYVESGTYTVTLKINGVDAYLERKVGFIIVLDRPGIPYVARFNDSDFAWRPYVITGDGSRMWEWGMATKSDFETTPTVDGVGSWITSLDKGHGTNTKYALESPVFVMRKGQGDYFLEFKYRGKCGFDPLNGRDRAGMKLEYRLDGGAWRVLGETLQGGGDGNAIQNWYNATGIEGLGGEIGWHSSSSVVRNPRYDISDFVNYESVQFRFVFGASTIDGAGFQVDDFSIDGAAIFVPGLWTGTNSSAWSDPLNWDSEYLPGSNTEIVIPETDNSPILNMDTQCKSLTIEPGGELTLNEGKTLKVIEDLTLQGIKQKQATLIDMGATFTVSGNTYVQQVIPNDEKEFVALQTNDKFAKNLLGGNPQRYNEGTDGFWEYMNYTTGSYRQMEGYQVEFSKNNNLDLDSAIVLHQNQLNTGEISIGIRHELNKMGYNLVGNPYPAYIDWDSDGWTKTKMDNILWSYNNTNSEYFGTFGVYNGIVGVNGASNIIRPGQAFYVQANSTGTLGVSNAVKRSRYNLLNNANNTANLFFHIDVQIDNGKYKDQIAIGFAEGASTELDSLDAHKIMSREQLVPSAYWLWGNLDEVVTDNKRLAINYWPKDTLENLSGTLQIPIGFSLGSVSTLVISASNLDNLDPKYNVYIKDNELSTLEDLRQRDFRFPINGELKQRYSILISTVDLTTSVKDALVDWNLFSANKNIIVERKTSSWDTFSVELFDLMGKQIVRRTGAENRTELQVPNSGVYMVRITDNNKVYSQKVFVQ